MTATRFYSSTAGQMFLSGAVTSGAISAVLTTVTGLPVNLPYTLLLDPGLATEEVVEVTAIGGTTVTVTRGVDGTSAQAHSSGAEVLHGFSARDFQDSRNHEANTTTAHGVTGVVVGTTNTQTLTGKTISGASNTLSNVPQGALPATSVDTTSVQTLTNKTIDSASNTLVGVVDLTSAQTLTNKTIDVGANTFLHLPGSTMGTPTATSSVGTSTSGTTEIRDAVLGDYAFTAVAGHRYRVIFDGIVVSTNTATDIVSVRVRNGGGSTPTAGSTLVASGVLAPGQVGSSVGVPVGGTFVPGAGTVTLSTFTVRTVGTGVEVPAGVRELYAIDLGPA